MRAGLVIVLASAAGCQFVVDAVTVDGSFSGTGDLAGADLARFDLASADLTGAVDQSSFADLAGADLSSAGGVLTLAPSATPPAAVDLTADGTFAWGHWGLTGIEFDHKSGSSAISDVTALGGATMQDNSWTSGFSWSDGTPTAAASNTKTGVKVAGQGHGLTFTVAADTALRNATLYVGVFKCQGTLVLHLSDGSAPDVIDQTLSNGSGATFAQLGLSFHAASPGQTLTITLTDAVELKGGSFVTLAAISVQ